MSTLRVDNIKSRTGTAVTIPSGQSLDVSGDVNVTGGLDVTGSSNFNTSGIMTAGTFSGSGSGLTGIAATNNIITGTAVTITNATDSTSTTTGSIQTDGGLGVAKDVVIGDDILLKSDAAVVKFGADSDVTLTHVAETGLLLNSSRQLQFGDSGTHISQSADGVLDLVADSEIEINATTIDINGNLDVSGTYTGGGLMTTGGNIVIPDAGNIGSATDPDAMAIASNGVVTFSAVPSFPNDTIETADIQDNAVTLAKLAGLARGKIIVGDSNGDPSALALGSNGQVLQSDGNDLVFGSVSSSVALDDIGVGDGASTLATSAGNITIDAQGSDTDIILKGTDGSSDITGIKIANKFLSNINYDNFSIILSS